MPTPHRILHDVFQRYLYAHGADIAEKSRDIYRDRVTGLSTLLIQSGQGAFGQRILLPCLLHFVDARGVDVVCRHCFLDVRETSLHYYCAA
jgi:hypothetical protein